MDHVSAGEATRDGVGARRRRMRDQARSRHAGRPPVSDRYQTPEWLDRSFVLPLTRPEASDVPHQPFPHHDDDARMSERETTAAPIVAPVVAPFVRPPSEHIDFATVVRRSDSRRTAGRLALATAGLAGLALIAYLLVPTPLALGVVAGLVVASLVCLAVRVRLARAPIPRLQR
jgi:hypothetical protein